MTTPTFSQIKALATQIRQKTNKRFIGVWTPGRWTGESEYQDGAETYRIEQCDSPLSIRIALRENLDERTTKILITHLDWEALGEDILLRLAQGRLHPINSWQIVKTLFQAQSIDPRLIQSAWMADFLIDWLPTSGYPPSSGGFLDAETVWSILLRQGIDLTEPQPDLFAILNWSTAADKVAKLKAAPAVFRDAAIAWLTSVAGSATQTILQCIVQSNTLDALPLGLAFKVLLHPQINGQLDKAIGKLEERYLGGITPDPNTVLRWSQTAGECLQQIDATQKHHILQRADQILQEAGAESFIYLSDTSPLGFEKRLAHLGIAITQALKSENLDSLQAIHEAHQSILQHAQAKSPQEQSRLERLSMAIRLMRGLFHAAAPTAVQSLAEAIQHHQTEGCFVDWARLSLRFGDQIREVSEAYTVLFEKVTELREQQAYQFALRLQNWVEVGSTRKTVLPIEHILDQIVAPLAAHAPVLAIVLDGMSMAVCRELVAHITAEQRWISLCQSGQTSAVSAGLAAIPSTTEVSRTSLLCGQLRQGKAADEKKGFATLPSLLSQCRPGFPPVLFHKTSLREPADGVLAEEVRDAIATPQKRIVGVVINAIDDHLSKGDQIDIHWSPDEIKVLAILLHEAKASNRLVILLSDHGHVIDCHTQGKTAAGGERWRIDAGQQPEQPEPGELKVTGARVILPDSNTLIAPWTERLRYGIKKNGYHGGLTPQEMVVPIAVLSPTSAYPADWIEAPVDMPLWWEEQTAQLDQIAAFTLPTQFNDQPDLGPLFSAIAQPESSQNSTQWIIDLLGSPIYKARKKVAGKTVPGDDVIAKVLRSMNSDSGKIHLKILSRIIGYPVTRSRSLLPVIQRILNVDGYTVMTIDPSSDIVTLQRELLCCQFGLNPKS